MARIVLLVTSPRLPAGLLTAAAWDVVRAYPVYTAVDGDQAAALRASGVPVTVIEPDPSFLIAALASAHTLIWLSGPAGDEDFARRLGLRLAREPALAELELMYGSWDPPGARLLDAVAVMDRLVSPGGDPWKRQQTHLSLAPYLLEESYEAYDAIVAGDLAALREELGDVLLQVVLHARLAADLPPDESWNIDDVAGGLVDKMIRRNPHVFAGEAVSGVEEITENWERIKKAEKSRDSVLDGIALSQPALALAAKILQRAGRAGLAVPLPAGADLRSGADILDAVSPDALPAPSHPSGPLPHASPSPSSPSSSASSSSASSSSASSSSSSGTSSPSSPLSADLGATLLRLVAEAQRNGVDAESALRQAALAYADAVRDTESVRGAE